MNCRCSARARRTRAGIVEIRCSDVDQVGDLEMPEVKNPRCPPSVGGDGLGVDDGRSKIRFRGRLLGLAYRVALGDA